MLNFLQGSLLWLPREWLICNWNFYLILWLKRLLNIVIGWLYYWSILIVHWLHIGGFCIVIQWYFFSTAVYLFICFTAYKYTTKFLNLWTWITHVLHMPVIIVSIIVYENMYRDGFWAIAPTKLGWTKIQKEWHYATSIIYILLLVKLLNVFFLEPESLSSVSPLSSVSHVS